MNLRKDHSHASNRTTVNEICEALCGDGDYIDAPARELAGGGVESDHRYPFPFPLPCLLEFYKQPLVTSGVLDTYHNKTFSDGCLGSNNDEGRSEV